MRLFISVCEAIQHAHQKGIIHRDIKPGNVLVALNDAKPVVKVIDFGIAKATGQALTDRTLATGFGAVVGTPEYMSPEQATLNNLDIDTRSDVYSLGVLLYELLTGTTPVDRKSLDRAALLEVLRIVREVDAPRPSAKLSTADGLPGIAANRGTEPAKLVKLFRGELDWVLLKSLEKDRGRRYQSANAFAADVRNFLADEVVDARPPSRSYRLQKFVRRNRAAVWASAAVFLALFGGVLGTTLGLLEARRQAAEAEQARGKEKEKERADGEAKAKHEADRKRVEADEEKAKAVSAADAEKISAAKERAAKETALKRLDQVVKSNHILGSIFDNLDPRAIADSRRPLQAVLVENLDAAVTALDGEAIGDPLVTAQMQFRLGCSLIFSVLLRRQSCCLKKLERPIERRREKTTLTRSSAGTVSPLQCSVPGNLRSR